MVLTNKGRLSEGGSTPKKSLFVELRPWSICGAPIELVWHPRFVRCHPQNQLPQLNKYRHETKLCTIRLLDWKSSDNSLKSPNQSNTFLSTRMKNYASRIALVVGSTRVSIHISLSGRRIIASSFGRPLGNRKTSFFRSWRNFIGYRSTGFIRRWTSCFRYRRTGFLWCTTTSLLTTFALAVSTAFKCVLLPRNTSVGIHEAHRLIMRSWKMK